MMLLMMIYSRVSFHFLAMLLFFIASLFALSSSIYAITMDKPTSWADKKYAAIVIDANTDKVLLSHNADKLRYPASLTKMMTLYVVFDELKAGRLRKNTLMSVSSYASDQVPSSLGLRPGQTISVDQAIRALVTKSANDVAVVIAEHIAGSEAEFARRMNAVAARLGMKRTRFRNASGLHDPRQYTTARDLSILSRALYRGHPDHYSYFSTRTFSYKDQEYDNHNRLLGNVHGVDGIKTGYTIASGFNLASSIQRDKRHVVAVVMGGPSGRERNDHMSKLLVNHLQVASAKKRVEHWRRVDSVRDSVVANAPIPSLRLRSGNGVEPFVVTKFDSEEERFQFASGQSARQDDSLNPGTLEEDERSKFNKESVIAELAHEPQNSRWVIQIGAYGEHELANARLKEALLRDSGLKGRLGYIEPVLKDDVTLYRARFDGFSQDDAKRTCNNLKKAKFKCFAMKK